LTPKAYLNISTLQPCTTTKRSFRPSWANIAVLVTQKKPWSETRKQKHTTWETPLNIEEEEEVVVVVEGERDRPPKRAAEEDHIFWEPRGKRRAAEVSRRIQQLEPNNSDGDDEHPHPSEVHWAEPETSQPPRGFGANDTSEPEGTPPESPDGASRRPHDEEKKWI
jgi:hypothetical protein